MAANNSGVPSESSVQTDAQTQQGTGGVTPQKGADAVTPTQGGSHDADTLTKIRMEEKQKHQGKIEQLQKEKETLTNQLAESNGRMTELEKKINLLEKSNVNAEDLKKELGAEREKNSKLEVALDSLATTSAQQLTELELDGYRQKRILEEGIKIPELVSGTTKEAIDAAVKTAKEREKKLIEDAQASANASAVDGLPKPISPNSVASESISVTPENRRKILKLPQEDYDKTKKVLLERAKRAAGIIK